MRSQVGAVAYLQGDVLVWLVKDGMAVRGDEIRLNTGGSYKALYLLTQIASVGMVKGNQLLAAPGFGFPERVNPSIAIY
jgi:hypothetical protein